MKLKADILINFIKYLSERKINYSLLGNTSSYPFNLNSDIDVAVSEQDFIKVEIWIQDFCKLNNYLLCKSIQHEITAKCFIVGINSDKISDFDFLAIDICSDYYSNAHLLIKWQELLKNNKFVNIPNTHLHFKICNHEIAFLYYFMKKIGKLSFKPEHIQYLSTLWAHSSNSIKSLLSDIFLKVDLDSINDIFECKNYEKLDKDLMKRLKKSINNKFPRSFIEVIKELSRKFKRIINPTGLVIAFMGCDGAGKSTIIRGIQNNISNNSELFRNSTYYHLYPSAKSSKNAMFVPNPHDQKKRSIFLSNLKLGYLFFRYLIGYWYIVFPKKIKNNLIVFDRYYHDLFVDPLRYRHNGSKWLTKLIAIIIPKPDIFFFIDAPSDIIYSRKQELSFQEIIRQKKEYLQLADIINLGHVINNSTNPDKAIFQVEKAIFIYLANRFKKRGN